MPQHPDALELLERAGPLAVTSANRTGEAPAINHEEARVVFGDVVIGYLEGEGGAGQASTVLDVIADPPVVLRPGPVTVD